MSIYVHLYFLLFPSIYFHLFPSMSIYFLLFPSISVYVHRFPTFQPSDQGGTLTQSCKSWQSEQEMPQIHGNPDSFFVVSKFKWIQMVEFRDVPIGIGGCFFPIECLCSGLPYFDVSICIVSIAFFALGSVGQATQTQQTEKQPDKTLWETDTMKSGREEGIWRTGYPQRQTLRWEPRKKRVDESGVAVCTIMLSSALAWNVSHT